MLLFSLPYTYAVPILAHVLTVFPCPFDHWTRLHDVMMPYAPGAAKAQLFCLACTVVVGEMAADGAGRGLVCLMGVPALLRARQA